MKRASVQEIQRLIEPAINALGYVCAGIELFPQGSNTLLRIYVENQQGQSITISDLEKASRQINSILTIEEPLSGQYRLEVSSPGLDRPLFTAEQYMRFINQKIHIRLKREFQERRNFTGILLSVTDDKITLLVDEGERLFALDDIDKANLVPVF